MVSTSSQHTQRPSHAKWLHAATWVVRILLALAFIAAGVSIETLRPLMYGIPQCKAPRVVVACREVTINGAEVTA